MKPETCQHDHVVCLNHYELVRKYRCSDCGAVMMCSCDEEFGRRFLEHQLSEGAEYEMRLRVPVTHGFVDNVCNECRGLPAETAPMASIPGRTSKIKRYYWRELFFAQQVAESEWEVSNPDASPKERELAFRQIRNDVLEAIKQQHASQPKYTFVELSQSEVIKRYEVQVDAIPATYSKSGAKGENIVSGDTLISAEMFASKHYETLGWSVMPLESRPFHALFSVMMWLLIQDPADPRNRMAGFGRRDVFEETGEKAMVWTPLPEDFGAKGYSARRAAAVEEHFALLIEDRDELLWMFDYWLLYSEDLRQYLWAHLPEDVSRARRLIEILPPSIVIEILRYLLDHYWNHYVGWPDLLLYREDEVVFVEVKSSSDRLSEDQKRWIADNSSCLKLPFRLAKVHKAHVQ